MIDGIYCNTHDRNTLIAFQKDMVYMTAQCFKQALDRENILS